MEGFTTCWLTLVFMPVTQLNKCWKENNSAGLSWNCLFDFHSNIHEIFTWSGNLFPGCMIKRKTVKRLIMAWTHCVWKLLHVEMQVWPDYHHLKPHWYSIVFEHPFRHNLDCLTCCKTPYSTTIRIQMAKRKWFATTSILWRTDISRRFSRSCMFM